MSIILLTIIIYSLALCGNAPTIEDCNTSVTPHLFSKYIGNNHGIQGCHDSSCLDVSIFGLFALSESFDELLLQSSCEQEVDQEIIHYLHKGIINPLRKSVIIFYNLSVLIPSSRYGLARCESVMNLQQNLLKKLAVKGSADMLLNPEEFLKLLFHNILCTDPFLTIR